LWFFNQRSALNRGIEKSNDFSADEVLSKDRGNLLLLPFNRPLAGLVSKKFHFSSKKREKNESGSFIGDNHRLPVLGEYGFFGRDNYKRPPSPGLLLFLKEYVLTTALFSKAFQNMSGR
jgi:hypothetical protein